MSKTYLDYKDRYTYLTVLHRKLRVNLGKAYKCENKECKYESPKRFEWALIKGKKYEVKKENFMMLCPSCHRKYDYKEQFRKKFIERLTGNHFAKTRKVLQIDKGSNSKVIWSTINSAAKSLGIRRTSITNCCSGRIKTAGGYKWQYVN